MPGDQAGYKDAIKKGHNAAWDGEWAKAIPEYRRAIAEFPEDVTAHLSLAHALEEAGQLESALHEFRIASKLQPHDPQPLARVARLQEKLRRPAEAAGTYLAIAEIFVAHKAIGKAVEAWQKAAALEPDRADVHQRLAEVYEQGVHYTLAAKEFLALARIYQRGGNKAKSLSAVQKALALDPHNAAARTFRGELERGESVGQASTAGPLDKAQQVALSRLAETLLEERSNLVKVGAMEGSARVEDELALSQPEIDVLITRAVDAQTQHRVADAVECYRKLLAAGVTRPEVKFNLGLLYSETMQYDDAIKLLSETVGDPNYALASHFELGKCFRAQGKVDAAVEHFLQVTKIVDLGSVRREQADELISVYEGLAESYAAKGDRAQAESFSRSLEEFLTSRGWEDRVREVRRHLEMLREEGKQISLAEAIEVPEADKVLEALTLSQEYLRRGKLLAAKDECFRAIEWAPNYLPAHVRLAEVLAKEGHSDQAKRKYQRLAELAMARGDVERAEGFYRQLLQIAPDDIGERSKFVDLLIQHGRVDAALEEYLELGEGYARVGQFDKAAEKFGEGVRLAMHSGIASPVAVNLRYRLAEARARQGDLEGALAAYQEIRQQSPEDERAWIYVVDSEFRLAQPAAAERDLEELLARYRTRGEPRKAIAVLEGLAQNHPNEPALCARLAENYIEVGEKEKALVALDALGELQLSAGNKQAAAATIRQLIAMNPLQVEEYEQLLQQIGE
jgi:tetratricopeptide (TPR) repeat protein